MPRHHVDIDGWIYHRESEAARPDPGFAERAAEREHDETPMFERIEWQERGRS